MWYVWMVRFLNAATVLSTNLFNNAGNYGPPTIGFGNGVLIITNASFPSSGVTAIIDSIQLSLPMPFSASATTQVQI